MRSMVEGAQRKGNDSFSYRIGISQNLARRNPHEPISLGSEEIIARLVILRSLAPIMSLAINLDDQRRRRAI